MSTTTSATGSTETASIETETASIETASIEQMRQGIDTIDAEIARLVHERTGLSRRIQAARMNTGGTRVELGRERVVIDGYRQVLGSEGSVLGEAVLRVCRGVR